MTQRTFWTSKNSIQDETVFGVPENDRKNTSEVIMGIIPNNLSVDGSHCLGPKSHKKDKRRGIIVTFAQYNIRDKVYRAKKRLKGSTPKIHILESLTAKRVKLLDDLHKKTKGQKKKTKTKGQACSQLHASSKPSSWKLLVAVSIPFFTLLKS